jgi:hypothetical protein
VTALLDACELLGAIELGETLDAEELDGLAELAQREDPDPTVVSLTPMGLWAVHQMLVEQGMHVPEPGELTDEDVEYVCVRLSGVRREVAEAELTAWAEGRHPADAAAELDRFLRRCDDPELRSLALHALGEAGAPGRTVAARHRLHVTDPSAPAPRRGQADGPGPLLPLQRDLEPAG